ncbi:MAG: tetratricopeptide repeat protein [Spirochaetales bacterium]|nr:tetratricopeptide repeat protein [Spirochaetales bacterium]
MKKIVLTSFVLIFILLFTGCRNPKQWFYSRFVDPVNYYIVGDSNNKKELRKLFYEKELREGEYESTFTVMQQIIKLLLNADEKAKLNLFLTTYTENNPEDPFNAYYLLVVARDYQNSDAYPFATHYYERILRNFPDLLVHGESIHNVCLKNLTQMVEEPELRINYYKELMARFSEPNPLYPDIDLIDKGPVYYYMAKTYEELGEWELAIQAYRNYLQYPDCEIPGSPDVYNDIKDMIAFYDYRDKSWIRDNLEDLKQHVQWAIWARNPYRLNQYRAKVNFFATAWEENANKEATIDDVEGFYSDLGVFMTSRLRCSNELDSNSNLQEAYLETWGWSYRIPTWYLYFRKISFPADPEINGKWEWVGVYLGEKPFSGRDED